MLGYQDDPVLGPTGATAIPEFGTSFVRGMLEETKPEEFDILVRLSGFSHGPTSGLAMQGTSFSPVPLPLDRQSAAAMIL